MPRRIDRQVPLSAATTDHASSFFRRHSRRIFRATTPPVPRLFSPHRPMGRFLYLAAFAYLAVCLYALEARPGAAAVPGSAPRLTAGFEWFAQVRSRCNPVELAVTMRRVPPPPGFEGSAFQAACLALAGRIEG